MNRSYIKPPNAHPQNGATIGILCRVSKIVTTSLRRIRNIPEVIISCAPHSMTIPEEVRHETRSKVSGEIDCNILVYDGLKHADRDTH
jgi:hypothetical protein